jgi:hypothetical protein
LRAVVPSSYPLSLDLDRQAGFLTEGCAGDDAIIHISQKIATTFCSVIKLLRNATRFVNLAQFWHTEPEKRSKKRQK